MASTARLVILGDSFSCGAGAGAEVAPDDTWGVLVARGLRAGWVVLAAPGARTRDVRADQLPRALRFRPTHATVLVGLNDVVRPGFDPTRSRRDLMAVVDELRRAGVTVLVCRLHNPMIRAPAPRWVCATVWRRLEEINRTVDACARSDPGVLVLDLGDIEDLHGRASWAVDRLHPSLTGHWWMAAEACATLRAAGWSMSPLPPRPSVGRVPGRREEMWWVVRHGIPWVAVHLTRIGPLLTSMRGKGSGPDRGIGAGTMSERSA